MSPSDSAPLSTPKRKRSQLQDDAIGTPLTRTAIHPPCDVALPPSSPADDSNASPQTKVTHRFRSLAIGRPRALADAAPTGTTIPAARELTSTIPETPQHRFQGQDVMQEDTDGMDYGARKRLKLPHVERPTPTEVETDLPPDQEQPRRKVTAPIVVERPGTPRVKKPIPTWTGEFRDKATSDREAPQQADLGQEFKWPPSLQDTAIPSQAEAITVAFRASMTWHEDEITIYDPDDSDDDGTGINGIGFKPTPAVAYARGVKRKQQLAEYRKREEREARARRSQRRRASPRPVADDKADGPKKGDKGKEKEVEKQRRKVRFIEAPALAPAMIATGPDCTM